MEHQPGEEWLPAYPGEHHLTAEQIYQHSINDSEFHDWDEYYKFSFVRNPWDREVSLHKYRDKCYRLYLESDLYTVDVKDIKSGLRLQRKKFWSSCEKYIKQYPTFKSAITHAQGTPICSNWTHKNDVQLVDYIGKFENVQENLTTICNLLGISTDLLPKTNTTTHRHYTEYYDDETREIVSKKYAKDIEYFGYKFGE